MAKGKPKKATKSTATDPLRRHDQFFDDLRTRVCNPDVGLLIEAIGYLTMVVEENGFGAQDTHIEVMDRLTQLVDGVDRVEAAVNDLKPS